MLLHAEKNSVIFFCKLMTTWNHLFWYVFWSYATISGRQLYTPRFSVDPSPSAPPQSTRAVVYSQVCLYMGITIVVITCCFSFFILGLHKKVRVMQFAQIQNYENGLIKNEKWSQTGLWWEQRGEAKKMHVNMFAIQISFD